MKIAIVGTAKSGTSAVYAAIRQALPGEVDAIYEPHRRRDFQILHRSRRPHVLAKLFLSVARRIDLDFSAFDRVVLLTRDPRDTAVSTLLFNFLMNPRSRAAQRRLIALLEEKEADPAAVPLIELARRAGPLVTSTPDWERFAHNQLAFSIELSQAHPEFLTLRYEDFVDGRLDALRDYLGLELSREARVGQWVRQVERSKSHGAWRHWFTPADGEALRPLFDRYLSFYGYPTDWTPVAPPRIDPAESSDYLRRNLRAMRDNPMVRGRPGWSGGFLALVRRLRGGDPERLAQIEAAAADGKPAAIRQLADAYRLGRGAPRDPARAAELLERACDYGEPVALMRRAAELLRDGDPATTRRALRLLRRAAKYPSGTAWYALYRLHRSGHDIPEDWEDAETCLERAARWGDWRAQWRMALRALRRRRPGAAVLGLAEALASGWRAARARVARLT